VRLPAWARERVGEWDLLVVALGAVMLVVFAAQPDNDVASSVEPRALDGLGLLILAVAAASLLFRRRYPLLVVVVLLALLGWWNSLGYTNGLLNVTALVAYFTVGATGDRRKQVAALALTAAPLVGFVLVEDEPWWWILSNVGWPIAAVLFGELYRSRRALLDSYQRRAESAEADRESEARRRVDEERMRIARDLHDLLGHTVSVMMVQAGVAEDKFDSAPDRARAAVRHIRVAGRQANKEVRATIGLLRQTDDVAFAPTPTIADIENLVTNAEQLGLRVDYDLDLEDADVDALASLTVYRVVQEGLTNVARHSTATRVAVVVSRSDRQVTCTIRDDGMPSSADVNGGFGLDGMSERVALAGGVLRCRFEEGTGDSRRHRR
jgi:signal transduction histidine kinase